MIDTRAPFWDKQLKQGGCGNLEKGGGKCIQGSHGADVCYLRHEIGENEI